MPTFPLISHADGGSLVDKVLRYGGVAGLLALILTFWLTQSFAHGQRDLAASQQTTLDVVRTHATESHADQRVQRQLLFAICLNSARSDDARALCEVGR